MAKGQKRSTREIRKPKAGKSKVPPVVLPNVQARTLVQKPKGKL